MKIPVRPPPPRGRAGVANWLIRPASGWHHKTRGMMKNHMFLPLAVIGGALLIALAMNAWVIFTTWSSIPYLTIHSFVLWVGFLATLTVPVVIYHHLVAPLFHLRHWAQRVRGGNLAARIPVPVTGEFAELARDVNALTEQLQRLTREMRDEVNTRPSACRRSRTRSRCCTTWPRASTFPAISTTC
jgi:two-component system, NarL family, nitrate/nitrite sensor histidine kinase NarX